MSIYQIAVQGVLSFSDQLRNIHHYEFFGYVPDTAQLQEAVDTLDAAYKTHLQANYHGLVTFSAYEVRRVDQPNLPAALFTPTAGTWNGTGTGDMLPPQVSALVTFKAATAFPRTTRTYHFPMTEGASQSSGLIDGTVTTNLLNWGNAILSLPITGGIDADKVAVMYGGTPRAVISNNDVAAVSVKSRWATQRRRVPGVGV